MVPFAELTNLPTKKLYKGAGRLRNRGSRYWSVAGGKGSIFQHYNKYGMMWSDGDVVQLVGHLPQVRTRVRCIG
jgi:hypothetical protein